MKFKGGASGAASTYSWLKTATTITRPANKYTKKRISGLARPLFGVFSHP
jgi:hypothetical protein